MDSKLRVAVRERAARCCEYCRRQQTDSPLITFHVEHILPRKHGGSDRMENLALACPECNLHKRSDLTGIDPQSNLVTRLFDSRSQQWGEHFAWDGVRIVGLTAVGRTAIRVLELNSPARQRLRLATTYV